MNPWSSKNFQLMRGSVATIILFESKIGLVGKIRDSKLIIQ